MGSIYFFAVLFVLWFARAWLPNFRRIKRLQWSGLTRPQRFRFVFGSLLLACTLLVWLFLVYYSVASFYKATFTNAPKPYLLIILFIGGYLFYFLNSAAGGFLGGLSSSQALADPDPENNKNS